MLYSLATDSFVKYAKENYTSVLLKLGSSVLETTASFNLLSCCSLLVMSHCSQNCVGATHSKSSASQSQPRNHQAAKQQLSKHVSTEMESFDIQSVAR
jgi:hypothetical protein